MRIEDLPRPWLLAAMTGLPVSALLERAERERAEQARQRALGDRYRRAGIAERHALPVPARLIEVQRLAS
jgi:hypothetical protein